jgi:hypothetical protein
VEKWAFWMDNMTGRDGLYLRLSRLAAYSLHGFSVLVGLSYGDQRAFFLSGKDFLFDLSEALRYCGVCLFRWLGKNGDFSVLGAIRRILRYHSAAGLLACICLFGF